MLRDHKIVCISGRYTSMSRSTLSLLLLCLLQQALCSIPVEYSTITKVTSSDAAAVNKEFGTSCALQGNHAVVGAGGGGTAGTAYAFTGSGSSWSQTQQLTPSSSTTTALDYYAWEVALYGMLMCSFVCGGIIDLVTCLLLLPLRPTSLPL